MILVLLYERLGENTNLHSFPTRRSSDLRLKVALLLEEVNVPWLDNADTKENVGGSALVKVTPAAVDGPAFVRGRAKVSLLLTSKGFVACTADTNRSTAGLTTVCALLVLL